ncbi:MAG: polyprenyl synthetase family protein [Blastochloris sp.]|nr:polyprenyl synthetase family protein [Blastochloris sp.]
MTSVPKNTVRKLSLKKHFDEIAPDLLRVDSRIRQQADFFDPNITGYVQYATETGGKRIRPALVFLSARASGDAKEGHLDLAVIVELIHLASLIHDDVLDNAQLRRAVPTMNAKWGTEISVLLGDCLFAHALKLCTHFDDKSICRDIADAANEVCTGEILQTQRRFDLKLSVPDYMRIIAMKTAALFRVSAELSARLNGVSEADRQVYRIYGETLGVAYQIYDDCLDLFGTESSSGKTLGTDLKKGKLTLPMLHMLQQLEPQKLEEVSEAILRGSDSDCLILKNYVIEMGGLSYSIRKAQELLEKSHRMLENLPDNQHLRILKAIAQTFIDELESMK